MKKNIITVTVNGLELSGTASELATIIGAMNGTSAPVAEKPVKAVRSDYVNKNKGFTNFKVNVDKNTVRFTHSDGGYLNEGFVRKALNARAKVAGAKWSKDNKVWEFTSAQKAKKFAESCLPEGLDDEVQKIIDQTNERNAKKSS